MSKNCTMHKNWSIKENNAIQPAYNLNNLSDLIIINIAVINCKLVFFHKFAYIFLKKLLNIGFDFCCLSV